jgi:hypothetical protein
MEPWITIVFNESDVRTRLLVIYNEDFIYESEPDTYARYRQYRENPGQALMMEGGIRVYLKNNKNFISCKRKK